MKKSEENMAVKEIKMPKYVTLYEKYKCYDCKLNRCRFINNTSAKCEGSPSKRTECIKRTKPFSIIYNIVTGIIIAVAFILIYSRLKDLLLSLAYIVIFMVGMDIFSNMIGFAIDKIFEKIEKSRRKSYEQKIENLKAMERQKEEEEQRQQEKENEKYKEINEAKELFFRLSNEDFKNLKIAFAKNTVINKGLKNTNQKFLLIEYKNFLKSIEELLEHVNYKNFHLSEIRVLFQFHLPKLEEYIVTYIEAIETKKESKSQREELIKLLEAFTNRSIWIRKNLKKAEAENLVHKMQALREVVHVKEQEENK